MSDQENQNEKNEAPSEKKGLNVQCFINDKDRRVVLSFGQKIHWLAMSPEQASAIAIALLQAAEAMRHNENIALTPNKESDASSAMAPEGSLLHLPPRLFKDR